MITAINANGYKAWGNNTAAYPSTTDPKDRWLAVRRFFDWDGNNFILTYFQKVDKPGNTRLIQSIVDSQNIIGNGYVARDYCAGYRTEFKSDSDHQPAGRPPDCPHLPEALYPGGVHREYQRIRHGGPGGRPDWWR